MQTTSLIFARLYFLFLVVFISCKNNDALLNDSPEVGQAAIETISTVSLSPEGNTGKESNPESHIDSKIFSKKVVIHYGTVVSITKPDNITGIEIYETNGNVAIKSTEGEVEYELTGTTDSGALRITSDSHFKVTLNGVAITNPNGSALNFQSDSIAFVDIKPGTKNSLGDGTTYSASEDGKGTLFSEGSIVLGGKGELTVKSLHGHAIVSDDAIYYLDANISVSQALKDGLHANDAIIIEGGTLQIEASDDGIQCEKGHIVINDGDITINSTGKAITASYDEDNKIDPYLTINGGKISIQTKNEGIESKSVLSINGGTIEINATDDAINAGTFIYINGGNIFAKSTSNDGIDSNGPMTITGGTTIAIGAGGPEGGIDCDRSTLKIAGGIVIGTGGSTSMPTASVSTQSSVVMGGTTAGQLLAVLSEQGVEAVTFLVPETCQTILFSSPKLMPNQTYSVYSGGTVTGADAFNGLYLSGKYEPGTKTATTFTTSSRVTSAGGNTGPGGR